MWWIYAPRTIFRLGRLMRWLEYGKTLRSTFLAGQRRVTRAVGSDSSLGTEDGRADMTQEISSDPAGAKSPLANFRVKFVRKLFRCARVPVRCFETTRGIQYCCAKALRMSPRYGLCDVTAITPYTLPSYYYS
jgi:hypothetical protein